MAVVTEQRERLATLEEVADFLGKSVSTLRYWRRTPGKGPRSFKVGTTVRYRWADVEAWLEAQERQGEDGDQ